MRKSAYYSGVVVDGFGIKSGISFGLLTVVNITNLLNVNKNRGFTIKFTSFMRGFYSAQILVFIPVNGLFLHTIHKTYNELQLIKLNSCRDI